MMQSVYFDTNIFGDLYNETCNITTQDLQVLHDTVKARKISILLSIHTVEEVLSNARMEHGIAIFRILLNLADWSRVVKATHQLLSDDIQNYARGDVPGSPFIEGAALAVVHSNLQAWLNPSYDDLTDLSADAYEAQQQKQHFKAQAMQARRQERADRRGAQRQSFRAYWQENVNGVIESLAEHEGVLDACRKRGLQGMLALKSIQMCVGMHLSYGYAQIVEPHTKIDEGDSRDIQHAIVASAADVFVTHDKEFRKLLKRIPIKGFQVAGLRDFLGQLSA